MLVKKTVVIRNEHGLHARPAALFVKIANRFRCSVKVTTDHTEADSNSIVELMTLAAGPGALVTITAEGHDAEQAVSELEAFLLRES